MAQYKICPDCGAHLDPCEACDCRNEKWLVAVELPSGQLKEERAVGGLIEVAAAYERLGAQIQRLERIA